MPRAKANNRTDLQLPKTAAPDQPYGDAKEQMDAQSEIHMAPSPSAAPAAPVANKVQTPFAAPGTLPYLHPTNRPDEPVTAGMDFGPGVGSEALAVPRPSLADNLAQYSGQSSTVDDLAATARLMGL